MTEVDPQPMGHPGPMGNLDRRESADSIDRELDWLIQKDQSNSSDHSSDHRQSPVRDSPSSSPQNLQSSNKTPSSPRGSPRSPRVSPRSPPPPVHEDDDDDDPLIPPRPQSQAGGLDGPDDDDEDFDPSQMTDLSQMTDDQRQAMMELHSMKLDLGYTVDEDPPEYDVTERLRQLNAELAQEPVPEEDDRERSIKFSEDPVSLVVPPPDYPSDAEDSAEDNQNQSAVAENKSPEISQEAQIRSAQEVDVTMEESARDNNGDMEVVDSEKHGEKVENTISVQSQSLEDNNDELGQDSGLDSTNDDSGNNQTEQLHDQNINNQDSNTPVSVENAGDAEQSKTSTEDEQVELEDSNDQEDLERKDSALESQEKDEQVELGNSNNQEDEKRKDTADSYEDEEQSDSRSDVEIKDDEKEDSLQNEKPDSDNQKGEDDDNDDGEKVLVERNGKFELLSAKDLSPEEREIYGIQTEGDQSHQPHPPDEPRPATANGTGRRKSSQKQRAQSAPLQSNQKDDDFVYISPYGLSKDEKKRLAKEQREKERREKEEKERKKREDERNREESEEAFQAWLKIKRRQAQDQKKEEQEAKKKEKERKNQEQDDSKMEDDNESDLQEERDTEEAYKQWLKVKKDEKKKAKEDEQRRIREYDEGYYVRSRSECNKAFKEWVKKKNSDLKKKSQEEAQKARIHKLLARRSRKSQQLAKAITQAQAFKYVDYYGYR